MRKELTSVAVIMAVVCAVVVFATMQTATRAQDGEDPSIADGDCPPDMCFSYATIADTGSGEADDTLGTCSCGLFYDPDCHYEYISAFQCIPFSHEDGLSSTEEWRSVYNVDSYWGLLKNNSGSAQLDIMCPIPTDRGAGSNKYYGDVAQVNGFFYHYNSSYTSSMYLYSARANDVEYHGSDDDDTAGQRTITITPAGANYYIYWYARIAIASYLYSSFHGLEICYDPD